jgi:hypothetical protein
MPAASAARGKVEVSVKPGMVFTSMTQEVPSAKMVSTRA